MGVIEMDPPIAPPTPDPDAPPAVCVAANMTESGEYGRRWLIVRDGELRVYAASGTWPDTVPRRAPGSTTPAWDGERLLLNDLPPADGSATLVHALPLAGVRGAYVEPMVGCAAFVVETAEGPRPLIRFTPDLSPEFGLAGRVATALAKGENAHIDPRDVPVYCPRCGKRLDGGTRVCVSCIDRGAVLRRLFAYALPYKFRMLTVSALMVIGVGAGLIPAQINRRMINIVLDPKAGAPVLPLAQRLHLLGLLVVAMLAMQVLQRVLSVAEGRLGNVFGSKIVGDIRTQLWGNLQRLSLGYFDKAQIGNLMARVQQDTSRMQQFLTGTAQQFIVQALQLVGVLAVMFWMNWELTLVLLIPAPFVVLVSRTLWPLVRRIDRRLWQTIAKLNVVVNDALTGIRVVKAFGQEEREITRFGAVNDELVNRNIVVANMWTMFGPAFSFVTGFGTLLIWYVGGAFVLHKRMDLGTLMAFAGYMGMVIQPLTFGSRLIQGVTTSITSAERVFEVMDAEADVRETNRPVDLPHIEGRVRFEGVEFGYVSHLPVLRDIDLDVAPGEMIGLVGHSGAGKSTMINLVCRLYDVHIGRITIDGVDIRRLRQDELRRQIGVVLQETFLFDGTIAENIAYARPEAELWEVMEAAKAANAHEFISAKPEGYDTMVGERGQRLSGGERQRIAIARAILHDPRILILDEATASVDSETERQIQQAIARLVKGRTTFAIAHRLSTLRSANRLAVFDHGRIVELGTHEELMDQEGVYHRLVKAQQDALASREVMVG